MWRYSLAIAMLASSFMSVIAYADVTGEYHSKDASITAEPDLKIFEEDGFLIAQCARFKVDSRVVVSSDETEHHLVFLDWEGVTGTAYGRRLLIQDGDDHKQFQIRAKPVPAKALVGLYFSSGSTIIEGSHEIDFRIYEENGVVFAIGPNRPKTPVLFYEGSKSYAFNEWDVTATLINNSDLKMTDSTRLIRWIPQNSTWKGDGGRTSVSVTEKLGGLYFTDSNGTEFEADLIAGSNRFTVKNNAHGFIGQFSVTEDTIYFRDRWRTRW